MSELEIDDGDTVLVEQSSDSDETLTRSNSNLENFEDEDYFNYDQDIKSRINAHLTYEGLYFRHYNIQTRRNTLPNLSGETIDFANFSKFSRRISLQIPINYSLASSGYYTDLSATVTDALNSIE